jgi:phage antirepressor YoqD-like protein
MDKGKLEIKKVNFMGDELVAIRENDSGKIFAGVGWICKGLGVNTRKQKEKLLDHPVLQEGVSYRSVPTNGGVQDMLVIDIEYLPMWLATTNPRRVKPEVKHKIVGYQRAAKDVLANAFASQYIQQPINTDIISQIPKSAPELLKSYIDKLEEIEELKPKAQAFDKFIEATNVQTWLQVAKVLSTGRTRLCKFLRQQEILMSDNVPYQQYIDRGYFVTKEITAYDGVTAFNYTQTLVTAKGVDFIFKLLNEVNAIAKAN